MLTLVACNEPCLLVVEVLSLESGIALYLIVTSFNQKNASLRDTVPVLGLSFWKVWQIFGRSYALGKERIRGPATLREKPNAETTWRGEGTRLDSEDLRNAPKRKNQGPLFSMT